MDQPVKKKLVKYRGALPLCVEGFPADCQRSREGALHLRPGQTTELTEDEYAWLKANKKDVSKELVLLRDA